MKRIVMILGGKGGTGKTAFTRLLLDVMHNKRINYLAYDADRESRTVRELSTLWLRGKAAEFPGGGRGETLLYGN